MKAWHFLQDDGRLQWKCGRTRKPKVGQTLKVKPPIALCERGLHASKRAIDALKYAPGAMVCRVELGGEIIKDTDKMVATERTILWQADATRTLHEFACLCAEDALRKAKAEDKRCWDAVKAKRKWLDGLITTEELSAAKSAAWSAAWSAESAAWSAAESAARSAQNKPLTNMLNRLKP